MSTNNINNIALIRGAMPNDGSGLAPAVTRHEGRARCGARLEVVRQDPSGAWTWSEVHLGLLTKAGRLDMSSFPRKDLQVGGYTRSAGKRQVIKTGPPLQAWQESNLVHAQGRIQRGAHPAQITLDLSGLVSCEERVLRRKGLNGKITEINWLPQLISGEAREGACEGLGLPSTATDAELVEAGGGSVEKGLLPLFMVKEAPPEAVLLDFREFNEWVAVEASSIPGLISLAEYQARESEFLRKQDLQRNGSNRSEDTSPAEAAGVSTGANVPEEAQG